MSSGQPISSRLDAQVRSNRELLSRRRYASYIRCKYPGSSRVARADTPHVARGPRVLYPPREAPGFSRGECHHPEVEFPWPPSLPYGGSSRGQEFETRPGGWSAIWDPLQPTEAERRMDPRVVAANDEGEVVVLWRQRGLSPSGERFDSPVLGLYQVREGKFARAQRS